MHRLLPILPINTGDIVSILSNSLPEALKDVSRRRHSSFLHRSPQNNIPNSQRRTRAALALFAQTIIRKPRSNLQAHINIPKSIPIRLRRASGDGPGGFPEAIWRMALRPEPAEEVPSNSFWVMKLLRQVLIFRTKIWIKFSEIQNYH